MKAPRLFSLAVVVISLAASGRAQSNPFTFAVPFRSSTVFDSKVDENHDLLATGATTDINGNPVSQLFRVRSNGQSKILSSTTLSFRGIAIDPDGSVWITGSAFADSGLPVSNRSYQQACSTTTFVPSPCAFILKLTSDFSQVLRATYVGGSDWSEGSYISLAKDGSVIVTGWTQSCDFPVTQDAAQRNCGGGHTGINGGGTPDVFISRLSPDLNELLDSSLLGGTGAEIPSGLVISRSDDIYVAGITTFNGDPYTFPATVGAFQTVRKGATNGFVARLDPSLSRFKFLTLLGGSRQDIVSSIAVDAKDRAIVAGGMSSPDFPVTNRFGPALPKFGFDAFVVALSPEGSELQFSPSSVGARTRASTGYLLIRLVPFF